MTSVSSGRCACRFLHSCIIASDRGDDPLNVLAYHDLQQDERILHLPIESFLCSLSKSAVVTFCHIGKHLCQQSIGRSVVFSLNQFFERIVMIHDS